MTSNATCNSNADCSGNGYCIDQVCSCAPFFEGNPFFASFCFSTQEPIVKSNKFVFFVQMKICFIFRNAFWLLVSIQVDKTQELSDFFWIYCYVFGVLFFGVAVVCVLQLVLTIQDKGWKNVSKILISFP
jgi:hypothetical protein